MREYNFFWIPICVLIFFFASPAMAGSLQTVPAGGTVFIGEQGLDVSAGIPTGTLVSWYNASQQPGKVLAAENYRVADPKNFNVNAETFRDYQGKWYINNTTTVAFVIADPTLDLKIWDQQTQTDISGQTIPQGDYLNFRIDSNLNVIPKQRNANDGFLAISVRNSGGNYYSQLKQDSNTTLALTPLSVNTTPFYWVPQSSGSYGWNTGTKLQNGDNFYADGAYSVSVDLTPLNSIRKNYDAVGKTKSVKSITLSSGTSATATATTTTTITTATPGTTSAYKTPIILPVTTGNGPGTAASPAAAPVTTMAPAPVQTTTTPRTTVSPGFEIGLACAGLGIIAVVLARKE